MFSLVESSSSLVLVSSSLFWFLDDLRLFQVSPFPLRFCRCLSRSVFVLFGLLQSYLVSFRLVQSCPSLSWSPSSVFLCFLEDPRLSQGCSIFVSFYLFLFSDFLSYLVSFSLS